MSTATRQDGAPRVLYVDDEEMTRALFAREMGRHGFAVTTAPGGLAGLRECESKTFDLVVSDLRMPRLDGLEKVRGLAQYADDIPVPDLWFGHVVRSEVAHGGRPCRGAPASSA